MEDRNTMHLVKNSRSNDDINIIICGDFCPDNEIEKSCLKGNFSNIYNNALNILKHKDISIVNLECTLTKRFNPIEKSGSNLIADPSCIHLLKYFDFDVVTLANNHILDHGKVGLKDTIDLCKKAGIDYVWAGEDLEDASKPLIIKIRDRTIGLLNFTEHEFSIADKKKAGANPLDPIYNYYQILNIKGNVDYLIIIIHGGNEFNSLPSPRIVKTYRFFADLGVSAIIGHHTHCPSGYEIYNNVPIFYGLGNFLFYRENFKHNNWYYGYFVKLTLSNNAVKHFKIFPYYQSYKKMGLELMKGDDKKIFINKIQLYNEIIKNPELLENEWLKFCESKKTSYLIGLFGINKIRRKMLKINLFFKMMLRRKEVKSIFLNYIRCEAHRDVILEILEREHSERSKSNAIY